MDWILARYKRRASIYMHIAHCKNRGAKEAPWCHSDGCHDNTLHGVVVVTL